MCRVEIDSTRFNETAVSNPSDRSKRFTPSPDTPVHSDTNSPALGSIQSRCTLRKDYPFTFPPTYIARHSSIGGGATIELTGASWRERNCATFETAAKGIRTQALLIENPVSRFARVYAVCVCNKVRLPGTGQSAHVIGGSRFTRPASNSRRTLLN